jgi:hypothetical protein
MIAAVDFGLNPTCHIYSYHEGQIESVKQIPGICELEINKIVISRDGKRLLSVSGCPNYNI